MGNGIIDGAVDGIGRTTSPSKGEKKWNGKFSLQRLVLLDKWSERMGLLLRNHHPDVERKASCYVT